MKTEQIELIECGCCGAYHPIDFYGDCRDDDNRFPTPDPKDKEITKGVA